MSTILLTGFEAFGNTPVNPAEQVARDLDGSDIAGARIASRIIPNVYFKCIDVVAAAIDELQPEAVIMMGEAGGRPTVTVERVAHNINDNTRYRLPDNDGRLILGEPTAPDGPAAYFATLPVRAMVRAMRDAGVPADISDDAGTFCCNHLMYGILHHIAVNDLPIRAGWVHLPRLPEVAVLDDHIGTPSMSLATSAEGLRAGIAAIRAHETDTQDQIFSRSV